MLVDAGETTLDIAPKPNASVPAYEVYGKYIKHFMPQGHDNLDYMSLSHFHIDHMGSNSIREAAADGYVHTGVSAVYDLVKFETGDTQTMRRIQKSERRIRTPCQITACS